MEELCGSSFSKSNVSDVFKTLDESIQQFQIRELKDYYPFVIVDARYFKIRKDHAIVSKALLVAMGITEDGRKEIIGFDTYEGETETT